MIPQPRHCSLEAMRHVLTDLSMSAPHYGLSSLADAARRGAQEMREMRNVIVHINGQRMHSIKNVRVGYA